MIRFWAMVLAEVLGLSAAVACPAAYPAASGPLSASDPSARDGLVVSLVPDTSTVAPGEAFTLGVRVETPDIPFNGYELTVGWDSTVIEFRDAEPGPLMPDTGVWWRVYPGADSVRIEHVVTYLVNGPGIVTWIHLGGREEGSCPVPLRDVLFARGSTVLPIDSLIPAVVIVRDPASGVRWTSPTDLETALQIAPQPVRPSSTIRLRLAPGETGWLRLLDAGGRLRGEALEVRAGSFGPGLAEVPLRLLTGGRALPSGVYFLRLGLGNRTLGRRIVMP